MLITAFLRPSVPLSTWKLQPAGSTRIKERSVHGRKPSLLTVFLCSSAGCLGDQQAAMLGQRCTPGTAKSTYGTGCFVLLHTGPRPVSSSHGLLSTMAYRLGAKAEPQYALEVHLVC